MEIIKINACLDGGSVKISTNDNLYFIDSRIGTKTKGCVFIGYPKDDNFNMVGNQTEIKMELKLAIENYRDLTFGNFDWKPKIYELLNY